jgi:glycine cleavage system H protein
MVALFVILTIVVCIGVDGLVQWRKSRREGLAKEWAGQLVPVDAFENMSAPANVFLDSGHTWVKVKPSGNAEIGLDRFAEGLLGRVDAVVLPEVGKKVARGDVLFALRQDNRRAAFAAPLDGVVTDVHKDVNWQPDMIHADPYKYGWICSLKPMNLARNLKQLRVAEEAGAWLKAEAQKFQRFLGSQPLQSLELGHVLQDGGRTCPGVLEFMDDGAWKKFNEFFLRSRTKDELVD